MWTSWHTNAVKSKWASESSKGRIARYQQSISLCWSTGVFTLARSSPVFAENGANEKIPIEERWCGAKCLIDVRGERLKWADCFWETVTTGYSRGLQETPTRSFQANLTFIPKTQRQRRMTGPYSVTKSDEGTRKASQSNCNSSVKMNFAAPALAFLWYFPHAD